MADVEQQMQAAEETVAAEVRAVLDEVAAEISRELGTATEIVAARFSLAQIGRMWRARVPRIVRRLLGVAEAAAGQAAADTGVPLPDGWDGLPGRQERGDPLPASLGSYVTDTEHLLRAVGDRLTAAAVTALAAGLDAGEDIEQLRARLRDVFSREGAQLGETREERVARTESVRAWNAATLAAAQALTRPDRPLVKQWLTRHDARVRHAHDAVDGALRLIDEAFTVAGVPMQYPGDPLAPAALTVNCRCVLRLAPEARTASAGSKAASAGGVFESKATVVAAAATHTGAMIALLPSEEDAQRLALADGEPPEELHCTLAFLGDGDAWNEEQRATLVALAREYAPTAPIPARAFGVAHWNPYGDDPVWVWSMGDDREGRDPDGPGLQDAHTAARFALQDAHDTGGLPDIPEQHTPWHPHVTAIYDSDPARLHQVLDQIGPVTFDRLRIAFAGDHYDIPLAPPEEEPMATPAQAEAVQPAPPPVRTWSTPDGTGLAFENRRTGDGRIFAPGALRWGETGPWPISYCERMGQAHEGAELAGAIEELGRDGDRITGRGSMYLSTEAGWEAVTLLDQSAPLGISVDLDDVSVQILDNTVQADQADGEDMPVLLDASFSSASVMRLDDGAWQITATSRAEWTASGIEMTHATRTVSLFTSPGGAISRATARQVFGAQLTAAAGDPDNPETGVVVHEESSGDYLMRITDARVRGATLVSIPAFDEARIVLDPPPQEWTAAGPVVAAAGDDHEQVVTYVCSSPVPVSARDVADALSLEVGSVRSHISRALESGRIVRLARGRYVGASTHPEGEVSASIAQPETESRRAVQRLDALTQENGLDAVNAVLEQPGMLAALYGPDGADVVASAMRVMKARDPFPAAWFREPTEEELPPDSGGVHVVDGRAYGWVAQAGVPHEVHGRKVTIEKLAARGIDTSYFLRTKLQLDDGSEVAVGPMTMNAGHHRDGYECETSVCQFDDSRTVGAVVTVGINDGGMWFSGAAGEWLSAWDGLVFRACVPSYHMTQAGDGTWQLKAVLSVPTPGHPSRLAASAGVDQVAAVIDRSNIAITAAAAALGETPAAPGTEPEPEHARPDVTDALTVLLEHPDALDGLAAALERRQEQRAAARAELDQLAASIGEPATTAQQEGN